MSTAARNFPFGGVPVYNPQSLNKEEALAQFHARQAAYQGLIDLLREERPSHVLIIGTRGMGKTTLLQRVQYGVEDDSELNSRYLPLSFPEEQYNVNRLHHFLLNTVDALADALERIGNTHMLAKVESYAEKAGKLSPEEIREDVPKFLTEITGELQRSILLLVDNADRLFETIEEKEQWRLRELLSNRRDLTFFGATTHASEGIYSPNRAFFEFFKIVQLAPLTLEEVRTLLLRLSDSVEEKAGERGSARRRVEAWLAADAARLRTLVQLTGGNPRTTVLLFHLVLDGLDGGAREYLEQLLDQCTPNYKGRVDELPPQAQQVLDALALRWDPATAMEVATDTGLETSAVSTQLTRLLRQGILEKADPGDSKKAMYQVAERFFNIWYLMRASRRVRAKLRWFVEFLRVFFDSSELEQITWERLDRFRHARRARPTEIESTFAYAIASGLDPKRLEDYLRRKCADLEKERGPFLESTLTTKIEDLKTLLADPDDERKWRRIGSILHANPDLIAETESWVREAINANSQSAIAWGNLGALLCIVPNREKETETVLRKAVELDQAYAFAWGKLGEILRRLPNREAEAEVALRKAINLDLKNEYAWGSLGALHSQEPNREIEAEAALRKAIDFDPEDDFAWGNLGDLLRLAPNREAEAETALRRAIDLHPEDGSAWGSLGALLSMAPNREAEAEAALQKAIELNPEDHFAWGSLGDLLRLVPNREQEAEAALRKVIELKPGNAWAWINLGRLLAGTHWRRAEAEVAFNKALDIEPGNVKILSQFAFFLHAGQSKQAETAFRKALESCRGASSRPENWSELLKLSQIYWPYGEFVSRLFTLAKQPYPSSMYIHLHRAVALAQLRDFPRASVALEDALIGDPIELLSWGREAIETFSPQRLRVDEYANVLT